jgi:hypothetical protein
VSTFLSHPLRTVGAVLAAAPPEVLPKITPYLLERADRLCPRRLACELSGRKASAAGAFVRWRVRDPLVDAASLAQVTMGLPEPAAFAVPPPELEAEEQALFARAASQYLSVFGSTPAVVVTDPSFTRPTESQRRGIRLGGGIDVVAVLEDDSIELRQLELWRRPLCADPFTSWPLLVAGLRLARWARGRSMVIRCVDLLGDDGEASFSLSYADSGLVPALASMLDDRLSLLRSRADKSSVAPGVECSGCGFLADCPALREPSSA